MEEVFRARNVDVPNDKGHGLTDFNLSIKRGEILGIFGNRYAGKNKVIGLITGEVTPSAGMLFFDGILQDGQQGRKGRPVAVKLGGESLLIDELSIWDNLAILWGQHEPIYFFDRSRLKKMVGLLLEDYGISFSLSRKVKTLSQMEKLYLEILVARHRKAEILLIDSMNLEGTTLEYDKLRSLLNRLKKEGMSIVYFSHQMNMLPWISDRIAFLYDGRIIKVVDRTGASQEDLMKMLAVLYEEEMKMERQHPMGDEEILSVRNLDARLENPVSFSIHKGEFVTVVSPNLELFHLLQERILGIGQVDRCELRYRGKCVESLKRKREVFFLNTAYLDRLIEEMTPMENLCMGLYEKMSLLGFGKKAVLDCLEREFYEWYGHEGMLRRKDCSSLYRKDRIAINLYRLRLLRSSVIICNDLTIHNDIVTYRMVKKSLAELLERGTAVCMITGDITYTDDLVERYVTLSYGREG